MLPSLTGIEQARQRSKVVLPAPNLPMMATNSPGRMVAVTCSRACLASKRLLTRSSTMNGASSIRVSALVTLPLREGKPAYRKTRSGNLGYRMIVIRHDLGHASSAPYIDPAILWVGDDRCEAGV